MLVQFVLFKLAYPFPDFFSDSYSYIGAARDHLDVNIWPIGYSKFLALFHWFTASATALVAFQYFSFVFAALYFFRTTVSLYSPGRNTRIILRFFLFFNPLFLYLANCIASDMLFLTMSLAWLAQLLQTLHRPRLYQPFLQAFLLLSLFAFRYNAMIYPLVTAVVYIFSSQKVWIKLLGILAGPALILPFIVFSSLAAKRLVGVAQFPPIFGGWQWANNALYIREYVYVDTTKLPTQETMELDRMAMAFFRAAPADRRDLTSYTANFFIRENGAPLKQYFIKHRGKNEDIVADWGKAGTVFDQYGKYIIRRNPLAFARYFMLLNAWDYFIPPLEKFEVYNTGQDRIRSTGQIWFQYSSPNVWAISKTLQGTLLVWAPILFLVLNLYFAGALSMLLWRKRWRDTSSLFQQTQLVTTCFLSLNFFFSIFTTMIVLRYELFAMIVLLTFAMLTSDQLESIAKSTSHTSLPGNSLST
jgi:hypothetical protein